MSGHPDTELYFVLIGRVGRCTVWPCAAGIPSDWRVAFGPDTRDNCAAYAERHRRDAPELVGRR